MTLGTDMIVNDGARLLAGETRISYSPNERKTVVLKYDLSKEDTVWPNFK